MEKRKNNMNLNVEMNRNNKVLAGIVFVLLLVTGILPFFIKLVVGLVVGVIGLVVGLVVGAIALIVGLFAGIVGLFIGLLPIAIPVAIVYYLVKNRNSDEKPKRKNDFDVDFA